jgi:hypothetical protein
MRVRPEEVTAFALGDVGNEEEREWQVSSAANAGSKNKRNANHKSARIAARRRVSRKNSTIFPKVVSADVRTVDVNGGSP